MPNPLDSIANPDVLIVDDSVAQRMLIKSLFSKLGLVCTEAINGIEGLERMKEFPNLKLVLLDVNMPEMNGIAMLKEFHANSSISKANIIVLTTSSSKTMLEEAQQNGAKGWVIKPPSLELLKQIVTRFCD